jgi:hypothetical protein
MNAQTTQQNSTIIQGGAASTIGSHNTLPPAPDSLEHNRLRFMAIVEVPYINLRNGRADWGFCCYACHNHFGKLKHSRRQFLIAGVREHIRQCGEIVDDEHVGVVDEDEIDEHVSVAGDEDD